MKYLKYVAYALVLIGGINWGIYGVAGFDVVDFLFGNTPVIARVVYVFVGLATVYMIVNKYVPCACAGGCVNTCGCSCDKKQDGIEITK